MRSHSCSKCQGTMTEGFVPSQNSGVPTVNNWFEGAPTKGWWGNVKLPGKPIRVATWRCQRCGFLESYAKP